MMMSGRDSWRRKTENPPENDKPFALWQSSAHDPPMAGAGFPGLSVKIREAHLKTERLYGPA